MEIYSDLKMAAELTRWCEDNSRSFCFNKIRVWSELEKMSCKIEKRLCPNGSCLRQITMLESLANEDDIVVPSWKAIVSSSHVSTTQKKEADELGAFCFSWGEFLRLTYLRKRRQTYEQSRSIGQLDPALHNKNKT
ncbi:hypothetical protein VNO78_05377 [Psophocarpus tetragonolobus]|uniref:Uncharacterized protein n=1 Tax=Psophocarpus tetragonolobus TaxID=3891 RepID=A0AAN9XQU5_PSOTE